MKGSFALCWVVCLLICICIACKRNDKNIQVREMKGLQFKSKMLPRQGHSDMNFQFVISAINASNILEYNVNSKQQYLNRIYYFSYRADNDFYIESGNAIIPCNGVIFERDYNLTKDIRISVDFSAENISKEFTLVYNAEEFGLAPVKFIYRL